MLHSKTNGSAAHAAPSSPGVAGAGTQRSTQNPFKFDSAQEFAALWHFFYKFMESLKPSRLCEDELWRRLDMRSQVESRSMHLLMRMLTGGSPHRRVDADNLVLVWKLCSLSTQNDFSRYVDVWLRGLRTFSLPEHLPGGEFEAPPEVVGSFETAALIADLIFGTVGHVDPSEVGNVWTRAGHWIRLAVADREESGMAFQSLLGGTVQLGATHWAGRRNEVSRIGVKAVGVSPDWVRRYRHAEIKIHWGRPMYRARDEVGLSVHQFGVAREQLQHLT